MFKFLYGDYEDVKKLLEWLSKEEIPSDFKIIIEKLYKERDKLQFKKYFKRTYPNNWEGFDPILCRDLEILKIAGVIEKNNGSLRVNRAAMNELLSP